MKYRILFLILAMVFVSFTVHAQTATNKLLYSPTTPAYLAKSYWLLNNIDPQNKENIDQYLMITECDLFTQYYSNDIEWDKIRDATRKYIETNKASFPSRFEFTQPIFLDRYDTATHKFALMKNSQMAGIKQMQISGNYMQDFSCLTNKKYRPDLFPLNAILTIARPLNYLDVTTDADTVKEYLKYIDDNNLKTQDGRPAYVRYRIKVEQSLTPVQGDHGPYAHFFGTIESMTVFGDRDMFIKLQEVKF